MTALAVDWRTRAREKAIGQFRQAWAAAPPAGRQALLDAAAAGRVGHRWETGSRACVLALLVRPLVRRGESPKTASYRFFGSDVTEDFPVTWDASGVSLEELLAAAGVELPARRGWGRAIRSAFRPV